MIKGAMEKIIEFAVRLNEKFNKYEPWKLVKENQNKEKIYELFRDISVLFALLEIYTPEMVKKYYDAFSIERKSYEILKVNGEFKGSARLMERISDEVFNLASGKDPISEVDLKVGLIKDVKDIKESEKLYYLTVDIGDKEKKIVAGLKKHYTPKDLLNKKVIIVNNLKKAKIMGHISEGMLLAATSKDGKVKIAYVDHPLIIPGSDVIIKGIMKKPSKEISLDKFRKIDLIKKGESVVYKGYPLIARSLAYEEPIKIEDQELVEDGAKLW